MSPDMPHPTSRVERQLRTLEGLLALDALELRPTLNQAAWLVAEILGTDKIDVFLYQAANQTLVALGVSPTPMGHREVAIGMDHQACGRR